MSLRVRALRLSPEDGKLPPITPADVIRMRNVSGTACLTWLVNPGQAGVQALLEGDLVTGTGFPLEEAEGTEGTGEAGG